MALADEEALGELRERLKKADCEVTDVVDHGIMRSIYFTDPNGIALEASCWTIDPTGHSEISLDDPRLFGDRDPVPAVRELAEGRLERMPSTRLVPQFTKKAEDWVVRS
ncbi:MAG: VOC family protein [Acidimicrobiia bacterium]|nr:VOC family protein [Acidimicrobiia bacterium]